MRRSSPSRARLNYAETARFWQRFFSTALEEFEALGSSIIDGFVRFHKAGLIEIITCGATHGYMPLLGTDESVRAQVRTGVRAHLKHIGEHPKGIWIPECGYRPAGFWNYPVPMADGSPAPGGFDRVGIEQVLSESNLNYFFVDTHLVESAMDMPSPYELRSGESPSAGATEALANYDARALYQPYYVDGPYRQAVCDNRVPTRSAHGRAGLVWRYRLPRGWQLCGLPQEALAGRSPVLAGDGAEG